MDHDTNADRPVWAANGDPPLVGQPEERTVVTLSCDGTRKVYVKREESKRGPISPLGVVVNLADRTVLFDGSVTPSRPLFVAVMTPVTRST
jgi:hypothetical protein